MDEQKAKEQKKLWGKPEETEKVKRKEAVFRTLSGGLTLVLALVIIAGGFALPSLLNPYIGSYNESLTQLAQPIQNSSLIPVPEESVALPPWNTYDESRVRTLSEVELAKLNTNKTADCLMSIMLDRGLQTQQDIIYYKEKILGDFRCLESQIAGGPQYFILYAEDLNSDGVADFRCAFDYDGKMISLILLSANLESLRITAPIKTTNEQQENENSGEAGGGDGDNSSGTGDNNNSDAGNTSGENNIGTGGVDNTGLISPSIEDSQIWAFSYSISREAYLFNQVDVFNAFRQLDFYYEKRYGYPFNNLLSDDLDEPELLLNDPLYTPVNQPVSYTTDEYQLSIYRLTSGAELVLYINPATQNCIGFNLRQYNPSASQ